jgi:hypothetical protein
MAESEQKILEEIRSSVKASTERKEKAIKEWLELRGDPKFSHIEVYDANEHHKAQEKGRKYKPADRSAVCDLCGKTGLKYFMIFKNSLKQEFVLGSSCAPLVSFGVPEGFYERTLNDFKKTYMKALRSLRSYDKKSALVVKWLFKVNRYDRGYRKTGTVNFWLVNGGRGYQRTDLEGLRLFRFLAEHGYLTEVSYEIEHPNITAEFTREVQ